MSERVRQFDLDHRFGGLVQTRQPVGDTRSSDYSFFEINLFTKSGAFT